MRAMILQAPLAIRETVVMGRLDGEKDPYASERAVTTADQFMFGPSMLVAPFCNGTGLDRKDGRPVAAGPSTLARSVILPPGEWFNFYTGRPVGGGTTITVTAAGNGGNTPVFVSGGSLIPMLKAPVNNTAAIPGADLEVRQYGRADATYDLYEDDGKTFDYERGRYRVRRLSVRDGVLSETVVTGDGPALYGTATLRPMMPPVAKPE